MDSQQCRKTIKNGFRCTNRALPGTEYCARHQPIEFDPVDPPSAPAPGSEKGRTADIPSPFKPVPRARPVQGNEAPRMQGLRADNRSIVVGPEGVIPLDNPGEDAPSRRLIRLLAGLSRAGPLPGVVRIFRSEEIELVRLSPPDPGRADLSRFYDLAAGAAAHADATLYVGADRVFVRYRDAAAPRGCDVGRVRVPANRVLFLVDVSEVRKVPGRSLREIPLGDVVRSIAVAPRGRRDPPETVFVHAPPSLYPLIARYFRDHGLAFRAARSMSGAGRPTMMLQAFPRREGGTGSTVPRFVMAWLEGLPRCRVLTSEAEADGRRFLAAWGWRHPCRAEHVLGAFPESSLVIGTPREDMGNVVYTPAPLFLEGDDLLNVRADWSRGADISHEPGKHDLALSAPIRLVPSPGPAPPTEALILDQRETEWLGRILHRLPAAAFHRHRCCRGRDRTVIIGDHAPIDAIPFGIPLRRHQGTPLFLPMGSRLTPELPWKPLAACLDIREDVYAFLTPDFRLDAPMDGFVPLSKTLVADPAIQKVDFQVSPVPDWAPLAWEEEEKEEGPSGSDAESPGQGPETFSPPLSHPEQAPPQDLRARADDLRESGDFLAAAVFFAILNDHRQAAKCFRQAAGEENVSDAPENAGTENRADEPSAPGSAP